MIDCWELSTLILRIKVAAASMAFTNLGKKLPLEEEPD
jgi:hypothetical protein